VERGECRIVKDRKQGTVEDKKMQERSTPKNYKPVENRKTEEHNRVENNKPQKAKTEEHKNRKSLTHKERRNKGT